MGKSIAQQQTETARAEKLRATTGFEEAVRKEVGDTSVYTEGGPTKVILTPENAPKVFGSFQNGSFRLSFGVDEAVDTIKRNPAGAAMGAASAIQPEAVTAALQGDYTEAVTQTAVGAGVGALVQQGVKKIAPAVMRLVPRAGSMALSFGARLNPVGAAYTGVELIDAAAKGITGKGIFEPSGRPVTEEDLDFATL